MPDDFKFPDEIDDVNITINSDDNTEVEIEIVDDVPEKDRGRKALDKDVEDPTDEEIESYSDKVQARIKELTHARHDERRVKESVQREKQELERLAQHLIDENKKLKQTVNYGQEVFISSSKKEAEAQLEAARRQYRDAQEAFDTDGLLAAQEALTDAKMRLQQVSNFKATPLQDEEVAVQVTQSQPQQVEPDEKSLRWQARNQWFGAQGFEEYTSYALGLHQKLVNAGIDPRNDKYFEQINARMQSQFPELFSDSADRPKGSEAPRKPAAVVAPATRSSGAKKVQLTTTQLALARKYGLTPQQYAAEVAKLEKNNG